MTMAVSESIIIHHATMEKELFHAYMRSTGSNDLHACSVAGYYSAPGKLTIASPDEVANATHKRLHPSQLLPAPAVPHADVYQQSLIKITCPVTDNVLQFVSHLLMLTACRAYTACNLSPEKPGHRVKLLVYYGTLAGCPINGEPLSVEDALRLERLNCSADWYNLVTGISRILYNKPHDAVAQQQNIDVLFKKSILFTLLHRPSEEPYLLAKNVYRIHGLFRYFGGDFAVVSNFVNKVSEEMALSVAPRVRQYYPRHAKTEPEDMFGLYLLTQHADALRTLPSGPIHDLLRAVFGAWVPLHMVSKYSLENVLGMCVEFRRHICDSVDASVRGYTDVWGKQHADVSPARMSLTGTPISELPDGLAMMAHDYYVLRASEDPNHYMQSLLRALRTSMQAIYAAYRLPEPGHLRGDLEYVNYTLDYRNPLIKLGVSMLTDVINAKGQCVDPFYNEGFIAAPYTVFELTKLTVIPSKCLETLAVGKAGSRLDCTRTVYEGAAIAKALREGRTLGNAIETLSQESRTSKAVDFTDAALTLSACGGWEAICAKGVQLVVVNDGEADDRATVWGLEDAYRENLHAMATVDMISVGKHVGLVHMLKVADAGLISNKAARMSELARVYTPTEEEMRLDEDIAARLNITDGMSRTYCHMVCNKTTIAAFVSDQSYNETAVIATVRHITDCGGIQSAPANEEVDDGVAVCEGSEHCDEGMNMEIAMA